MNRDRAIVNSLLKWHIKNRRNFPWREVRDPYRVLVAEFFLQRTPASRVARFLPKFLEQFPSPEKLATADVSYLKEFSRPLGLKKRISWLVESMKIVCQKYDGKIPDTFEDLISLPGVGEYTASAVLCFGFGQDIPIIDANVVRVLTRIFDLPETRRTGNAALKEIAGRLLPEDQALNYNEALLDFAALICKKRPLCDKCPLAHLCDSRRKIN
jgi:A/G-specific adenine glycosylase